MYLQLLQNCHLNFLIVSVNIVPEKSETFALKARKTHKQLCRTPRANKMYVGSVNGAVLTLEPILVQVSSNVNP